MSILNSEFVKEEVTVVDGVTYVKFMGISKNGGMPMHCKMQFTPKYLEDPRFMERIKCAIEAEFSPS